MSDYESSKKQAEEDGVWPGRYGVTDCIDCPFFRDAYERSACGVQKFTVRFFSPAEEQEDCPPEWCPLRVAEIRVVLES